jgi:hypothetical protein
MGRPIVYGDEARGPLDYGTRSASQAGGRRAVCARRTLAHRGRIAGVRKARLKPRGPPAAFNNTNEFEAEVSGHTARAPHWQGSNPRTNDPSRLHTPAIKEEAVLRGARAS